MKRIMLPTCLLLFVSSTWGQTFKIAMPSDSISTFQLTWDGVQERLVGFRDINQKAVAGAVVFKKDGSVETQIYPMMDLPGSQLLAIWAAAVTPDGGAVLAAIADYGQHGRKSFMMSYDASGRLQKLWDVDPCHDHRLAVDKEGDIFAFGDRHDPPDSNYPLFVKYSPDAKILGEFLNATIFPIGDEVVTTGATVGEHHMTIHGDTLVIYLSPVQELWSFTLAGKNKRRIILKPIFDEIRQSIQGGAAQVRGMGVGPHGEIYLQLAIAYPADPKHPARFGILQLSEDGNDWKFPSMSPTIVNPGPGLLMGSTASGKLVFLQPANEGGLAVRVE